MSHSVISSTLSRCAFLYFVLLCFATFHLGAASKIGEAAELGGGEPRNVILILSDDHRFDFMGFHPDSPKFLSLIHI